VATRKLIIAALCCGLLILLAGGVWLVATEDDDTSEPLLNVGETAQVDDLVATVADGQVDGTTAVLVVDMSLPPSASQSVTDLATGWTLLSPSGADVTRAPDAPTATGIPACATTTVDAGTTQRCSLTFTLSGPETDLSGYTAVFERGGDTAAWRVI
jgi:hypothetical protein